MDNNQTAKQKVREAFKRGGVELTKALKEYWTNKNKDPEQTKLVEYAESIFAPGVVDGPRVSAGKALAGA